MNSNRWKLGALLSLLLLVPSGRMSGEDVARAKDHCEQQAKQAYWKALKLCQLADNKNPRQRCYDAATRVYFQTLEDCREGRN